MGVYVYRSKHADVIKVGHFKGANAWGRVIRRGFYSCVCPAAIRDRVSCEDLELVAWFPALGTKDEHATHRLFAAHAVCGEWLAGACLADVVAHLRTKAEDRVHECAADDPTLLQRRPRKRALGRG